MKSKKQYASLFVSMSRAIWAHSTKYDRLRAQDKNVILKEEVL